MPTFRLTIEYEGTRYSGWQSQTNAPRTVQGAIERAAAEVVGESSIGGAGRTDAGVHAAAQVAHLRTRTRIGPRELRHGLNDRLPHDIHVLRADPAPAEFHARHDAVARAYLYQISRRRTAFAKAFVWWIRDPLRVDLMSGAAAAIAGRHDFARFADKRVEPGTTVVVVNEVAVAEHGDLVLVRISASHFLWRMVRKLVAALVEVGRSSLPGDSFAAMLRERGPRFEPTAPPSGLFLERVLYPGEAMPAGLTPVVPVATPDDGGSR